MKLKSQKGSALIEFVIILPILLLLLFGIIEFSILFYDKAVITNASREGARYGIVLRNPTYASSQTIATYTTAYCTNNLITFSGSPSAVTVTATPSATPQQFGDTLTVTVTYPYTYLVVYKLLGLNQQVNISATTVMAYE